MLSVSWWYIIHILRLETTQTVTRIPFISVSFSGGCWKTFTRKMSKLIKRKPWSKRHKESNTGERLNNVLKMAKGSPKMVGTQKAGHIISLNLGGRHRAPGEEYLGKRERKRERERGREGVCEGGRQCYLMNLTGWEIQK
jgi:hypothetical protein